MKFAPLLPLLLAAAQNATGAIIVTAPTDTTAGSLQITSDINFTLLGPVSGSEFSFVLDEWVSNDFGWDASVVSPGIAYTVNFGSIINSSSSTLSDNFAFDIVDKTANDGSLTLDGVISWSGGDIITLKAGTYSLGTSPVFNPEASQTFTGNMFLTDATGSRVSTVVAVPEPSSAVLLLLGVAPLARRRRK